MSKSPRKPRVVKLKESDAKRQSAVSGEQNEIRAPRSYSDLSNLILEEFENGPEYDANREQLNSEPVRSGFSWWSILLTALGGLLTLAIGLALEQFIRDLFQRQSWLGWIAAALTVIVVLALLFIILREVWAVSRLNTISRIRNRCDEIVRKDLAKGSERLILELQSIYSERPDLANARSRFGADLDTVFDAKDQILLFEQTYLKALDEQARRLVMQSAKRVSIVTAVSPRAMVDLLYVLMENTRLIRRISQLYGGRPGALGFWKLTRNVLGHLAVTGTIAAGDSLIQQLVGHGIAARLSAKLGEGIVNGLLTARIGLSAIDQARPMGFHGEERPGVSEFFTVLVGKEHNRQSPQSDK